MASAVYTRKLILLVVQYWHKTSLVTLTVEILHTRYMYSVWPRFAGMAAVIGAVILALVCPRMSLITSLSVPTISCAMCRE